MSTKTDLIERKISLSKKLKIIKLSLNRLDMDIEDGEEIDKDKYHNTIYAKIMTGAEVEEVDLELTKIRGKEKVLGNQIFEISTDLHAIKKVILSGYTHKEKLFQIEKILRYKNGEFQNA